jgi:hypothetical protein
MRKVQSLSSYRQRDILYVRLNLSCLLANKREEGMPARDPLDAKTGARLKKSKSPGRYGREPLLRHANRSCKRKIDMSN